MLVALKIAITALIYGFAGYLLWPNPLAIAFLSAAMLFAAIVMATP